MMLFLPDCALVFVALKLGVFCVRPDGNGDVSLQIS